VKSYQPCSSYLASLSRPQCPKCSEMMLLVRIEPDVPDHDRRTFECPKCQHSESQVVKYK
jgi:DNA-directed RNA polymerase subunit M/transcription elongation factor TFIIS